MLIRYFSNRGDPYFSRNIEVIINHIAPKIGSPTIAVGNERHLYETWTLVENSGVALAAWVLGAPISARFGAAYILADLRHRYFLKQAARDPKLRQVYRDEFAAIFEVLK